MRLCRNLKILREQNKLTKQEVSKKTGLAYSYIVSLENEKYKKNPSLETIDILAKYYDVDISTLFL